MNFCPQCGTRLRFRVVKTESSSVRALACDKDGYYEAAPRLVSKGETEEARDTIKVVGDKESTIKTMPTTAAECPKCGHGVALWWLLQTRSGDEPPTQFYRCEKCSHTWRQYA